MLNTQLHGLKFYRNSDINIYIFFSFQEQGQSTGSPAGVTQTPQYKGILGTYWLFIVCIRHFKKKKQDENLADLTFTKTSGTVTRDWEKIGQ